MISTLGGKRFLRDFVVQHGQAELLEIVLALAAAGRFAGRLNRRQQQGDEDADDGDHDQQLNQSKSASRAFHASAPDNCIK